ncbi:hypothetical protein [Brucella sp. BZ]|uniref:hypothetical protein n=1 Tax=Brucella sp. BZ TaxID=3381346 RepID=UPI0039EAECF6
MKLFMYRLSLKETKQSSVFDRRNPDGSALSREQWLRSVFSTTFKFKHRGNDFFFVPENTATIGINPLFIVGWIARDRSVVERTAPWDGLDLTEHKSWRAALLLLDPRHHEDGQKLALEAVGDVGKTSSILASLFNGDWGLDYTEPYSVLAFQILKGSSFASFAEMHRGKINEIVYDVAVPNMFEGPDDFSNELRVLRDEANIARVVTKLQSDGTINTDATHLDDIANHVEKGGGEIRARTVDGQKYNSSDNAVSEEIDTDGVEPTSQSYWQRVVGALDRIF